MPGAGQASRRLPCEAAVTAAFNVFAYKTHDHGSDLRRDNIPEWNLSKALAWAVAKGCDTILVELADAPAQGFRDVTHHLCADSGCPGGC